jgi:hypothetical protein
MSTQLEHPNDKVKDIWKQKEYANCFIQRFVEINKNYSMDQVKNMISKENVSPYVLNIGKSNSD